jgi:hypothetical protein
VQGALSETLIGVGEALGEHGGALESGGLARAPLIGGLLDGAIGNTEGIGGALLHVSVDGQNVIGSPGAIVDLPASLSEPDAGGLLGDAAGAVEQAALDSGGLLSDPLLAPVSDILNAPLGDLGAGIPDIGGLGPLADLGSADALAPVTDALGPITAALAPEDIGGGRPDQGLLGGLGGLLGH